MKYSEFKKAVESMYLQVDNLSSEVWIVNPENMHNLLSISKVKFAYIRIENLDDLDVIKVKVLLRLVAELASTPLEKRDDKKYNVVAFREKYGTKGAIKERKMFYYRNEDGYLKTAVSDFNAGPDQQWSMEQIKDWGLEDCERISVDEADSVDEA